MTVLSAALIGTWELVSREDRNRAGELRPDPALGADPVGLLFYDRGGRFALQLMKRERATPLLAPVAAASSLDAQNPASQNRHAQNRHAQNRRQGGYDAYFGTYWVDDANGVVTQTLQAALAGESVGQVLTREMSVSGDTLTIRLNATNVGGEAVTRILRWRRVA